MYNPDRAQAKNANGYKIVIDSCQLEVDFVRLRQQVLDSIYSKMKSQGYLEYPVNRLTYQGPYTLNKGDTIFKVGVTAHTLTRRLSCRDRKSQRKYT